MIIILIWSFFDVQSFVVAIIYTYILFSTSYYSCWFNFATLTSLSVFFFFFFTFEWLFKAFKSWNLDLIESIHTKWFVFIRIFDQKEIDTVDLCHICYCCFLWIGCKSILSFSVHVVGGFFLLQFLLLLLMSYVYCYFNKTI